MKIISMAWTDPAFRAGRKFCTRRNWKPSYAAGFHEGDKVQAYNRLPRAGGVQTGTLVLAQEPYLESTDLIPDEDWELEGFAFMDSIGATIDGLSPADFWHRWKTEPVTLYVVRFENVNIWRPYEHDHE